MYLYLTIHTIIIVQFTYAYFTMKNYNTVRYVYLYLTIHTLLHSNLNASNICVSGAPTQLQREKCRYKMIEKLV